MKWNDEIRIVKDYIEMLDTSLVYDTGPAFAIFRKEPVPANGLRLSIMKQENIRMALKEKYPLESISDALEQFCGLCMAHQKEPGKDCGACPVIMKHPVPCYKLEEFDKMQMAKTHEEFAEHHKAWCIAIDLWQEGWE